MTLFSKEKPTAFYIIVMLILPAVGMHTENRLLTAVGIIVFFLSMTPYIFRKSTPQEQNSSEYLVQVRKEETIQSVNQKIAGQKTTTSILTGATVVLGLLFLLPIVLIVLAQIQYPNDKSVGAGGGFLAIFTWPLIIPAFIACAIGLAINNIKRNELEHTRQEICVKNGIPLNPPAQSTTITPLLDAILSGNMNNVRAALQEHPEHLNTAYAQNGNTPLHVAAWNGQAEIVKLLLEQPGLNKTLKNNEGKTAADLAQEKNFTEIITLLRN